MEKAKEGGEIYVPYDQREGNESIVYFTRDLSAEGLKKVYRKIRSSLKGKIAVKLHTGEQYGPNIVPRSWVKELFASEMDHPTIVETNTFYEGDRDTTEKHRKTIEVNGWDFAPVDIMDEEGTENFPVPNGKWFSSMSMGSHMSNYDSMLVLTHFKGHTMGGFGGSNKNIGIGCADGKIGKGMIHQNPETNSKWSISKEEFMERMTESSAATVAHFGKNIAFINVMRNMSVSCDCEGRRAEKVVTPNVGILASLDILAIDQACVDIVFSMKEEERHALVERITSRHGLRQLSYMKEMGMGNDRYVLIDLDNEEKRIYPGDCVKDLKPFEDDHQGDYPNQE
ncbi:MAG: DUF362 domain-containing protein [Candidatus Enteromonas sp.]|nr:DUF362 domain-containing protein [bacterium]MDD6917091.1 DUF362 domain-containing protein [bacterium]MDY6100439.1 DUF362 domain-containing protein [Candidatus Enteromonas sp.]